MYITEFKDSADSQIANLETQVTALENHLINISSTFVADVNIIAPYLVILVAFFGIISCLLPTLLCKTISIVPNTICRLLWCCTRDKKNNKKNVKVDMVKDEKEQKLISA
jgi:hypothetical protein